MVINDNTNIGELVAEDYSFAEVFEQNNIDFFCHGNRSITNAAQEQNIDTKQLLTELELVKSRSKKSEEDYRTWPLDLLANHIEKTHHHYTEAIITELKPLLAKLVELHSEEHPELIELQRIFNISAGDMASHMKKEEIVLFPFIRRMVATQKSHSQTTVPHFGTVENPVNMMLHEHDEQSKLLQQMIKLTNNYTLPKDACKTYKITYATMKAFDIDMHKHIHLENNILFPKAVALEKTLDKH